MSRKYDIVAYIWPSYHYEPRMERFWPEKDGEWYAVRRAIPRFPGHEMPKRPLFGYQDEADPKVMRQHVELAAAHAINVFAVDWYWYEEQPCFERQLNDGLIPALAGTESKFYLMWANHDVTNAWDMHAESKASELLITGKVTRKQFEPMIERVINKFFSSKHYYRIDDKPLFSIFSIGNLISGLGGIEATRDAFGWLRNRMKQKGFPGIHLQYLIAHPDGSGYGAGIFEDNEKSDATGGGLISELDFDSASNYNFVSQTGPRGNYDYHELADYATQLWEKFATFAPVFFPECSCGWDNTTRFPDVGREQVVEGSTPFIFEAALHRAKLYLDARPQQPQLAVINSWNEWTEGSYLLPDMRWGFAYLEAVKRVFG